MNRVRSVDFLRIVFAFLIAFHHFTNTGAIKNSLNIFVSSLPHNTFNLPFIVDFFFIIAGFFLVTTYKKQKTIDFIKYKFSKLFPLMLLYITLIKFFSILGLTTYSFKECIFSLLLLDNVGITLSNSGVAWFISAYFVTICFYYHLIANFSKKSVNMIVFFLIYFSYSFLIHKQNGNISGTSATYYNIINVGMLRAIAGIGIGYYIAIWYQHIKQIKFVCSNKLIIACSLLEVLSLSYLTYFLLIKNPNLNSLIYILTFCILMMSMLINKGVLSKLLNLKIFTKLASYSLAVYMIHEPVLRITRPLIFDKYPEFVTNHIGEAILCYFIIVFVSAVIAHHLIEIPGSKLLNKLLFSQAENSSLNVENPERERESFAKLHQRSN